MEGWDKSANISKVQRFADQWEIFIRELVANSRRLNFLKFLLPKPKNVDQNILFRFG